MSALTAGIARDPRRFLPALVGLVGLLVLASLAPPFVLTARADTDLVIGGTAVIAYANGDDVRLRDAPGLGGDVITSVPEGSTVDVLDGPFTADDGSFWYEVAANERTGYIIADYLANPGNVSAAATGTTATTTDWLNLRAGPRSDQRVRLVMPPDATVEVIDGPRRGFYKVVYNGRNGWAHGDYLDFGGGDDGSDDGGGGGSATVIDGALNLRAGPSTSDRVLLVMPDRATVTLLGGESNGFLEVSYQGTEGWAYAAYLDTDGGGGDDGGSSEGTAVTTSSLNLRSGPSTADDVLAVMPRGAIVEIRGDAENGFYPVRYDGRNGWAYADYLSFGGDDGGSGESDIVWPFESGADWVIIQGYNGGTHQNRSALAQYYYALDLARVDGSTAGQSILSPVSGTVAWNHPPSGGLAIDMGNGYVLAMFHTTFRSDLTSGTTVSQGENLGYISAPGENGYAATPHLDMTLWSSPDGGRQSRNAAPYVGSNAISGMEFPDTGGYSQHEGTVIAP
ncbi:MAG: hypothetical protein QOJ59_4985 [Thermomicrobiales bacterium]|jgi:uncharacterized protein YraI|nr:hypothetical protein [Thermomicrobiales bacterium]